ncbi:hemagglutinin [Nitrosotalea sinensis]|uniref:hemagglutinin n=1 Tax=Nitrosotalea sinensis TaxID=1499975 RepID=UPI000C30ACF7|nr:hemagglutinin [Candidatus Nitrosotalea sinensis]
MKEVLKDPTSCPHCGTGTSGRSAIQSIFGLRSMGDGTVRVQSWCKKCRKNSSRKPVGEWK